MANTIWSFGRQLLSPLMRLLPYKEGGKWFYSFGGANVWEELKYLECFLTIPEVNAIINMRARLHSSAVYKVVNDKLEEQVNDPINRLLRKPNWFQPDKEFLRQTQLFHDIYGNEYLYNLMPIGMESFGNDKVKCLFTIPPNIVEPKYESNTPFFLLAEAPPEISYRLLGGTEQKELRREYVIHMNDNKVEVTKADQTTIIKGESKMKGLTPALNNIKMAYESRGVILKHRGALGLLSNAGKDAAGVVPLEEKDKKEVEEKYMRRYGGLEGQTSLIITNANLRWQQMSVNPDKLGLFQETEEDFNKILDAYHMPPELFVRKSGATYENQREARKGAYQDTVIPEAQERASALNAKYFPDGKLKIIADFSHLHIFQEDLKHKAELLKSMTESLSKLFQDGVISLEEYKSEIKKLGIGNKT